MLSLVVLAALVAGCSSTSDAEPQLQPFISDGCTLFPDRSFASRRDWCSCCVVHDLAYWRGGTSAERLAADVALQQCVAERTDNAPLANAMYGAVRLGGSAYFPSWYRWGYGWTNRPQYQALTRSELQLAAELAEGQTDSSTAVACAE